MPLPAPRPPTAKTLLVRAAAGGLLTLALLPVDVVLVRFFNPDRSGPWDGLLAFLNWEFMAAVAAFSLILGGLLWIFGQSAAWRRGGMILALYAPVSDYLSHWIKGLVARPRPQTAEQGIEGLHTVIALADTGSFPSGHVAYITAFALALLFVLPGTRGRASVLLLIPLMMWDRVALAVHFPSDTMGAVVLGLVIIAAFARLLGDRDPAVHPQIRVPMAFAALLLLTWAWSEPVAAVDPLTGSVIEGIRLEPQPLRTLLEPWIGPPLELGFMPGQQVWLLGPWALLACLLVGLLPRRTPGRLRVARAVVLAVAFGLWVLLAIVGRLPGDRLVTAAGDEAVWDPALIDLDEGGLLSGLDGNGEYLDSQGDRHPVVFTHPTRRTGMSSLLAGPAGVFHYFASLTLLARTSWMVWFFALWWWLRDRRVASTTEG